MASKPSEISDRSRSFGSASSKTLWSESWENSSGRKYNSYLFEKQNGIEVIEWQDLEDGNVRKRKLTRAGRRKRLAIQIVIVLIAATLLWVSLYFGLRRSNVSRNENSVKNRENVTASEDWNESENNVGMSPGNEEKENNAGADNIFSNSAKSNSTSPQIFEHHTLNPTKEKTKPATSVEPRESVVLYPNESLDAGQFRYSPNGRFKVGLTEGKGDFVLMEVHQSAEKVVWAASRDSGSEWVSSRKPLCFLQSDGNLVLRNSTSRTTIWMTRTHGNPHAQLVLDDSGRLALRSSDESRTVLWMEGNARQQYTGPSSEDMMFPIRGAFYYP